MNVITLSHTEVYTVRRVYVIELSSLSEVQRSLLLQIEKKSERLSFTYLILYVVDVDKVVFLYTADVMKVKLSEEGIQVKVIGNELIVYKRVKVLGSYKQELVFSSLYHFCLVQISVGELTSLLV